jgi:hypothetical protein
MDDNYRLVDDLGNIGLVFFGWRKNKKGSKSTIYCLLIRFEIPFCGLYWIRTILRKALYILHLTNHIFKNSPFRTNLIFTIRFCLKSVSKIVMFNDLIVIYTKTCFDFKEISKAICYPTFLIHLVLLNIMLCLLLLQYNRLRSETGHAFGGSNLNQKSYYQTEFRLNHYNFCEKIWRSHLWMKDLVKSKGLKFRYVICNLHFY